MTTVHGEERLGYLRKSRRLQVDGEHHKRHLSPLAKKRGDLVLGSRFSSYFVTYSSARRPSCTFHAS